MVSLTTLVPRMILSVSSRRLRTSSMAGSIVAWEPLGVSGLDESALTRGHRDLVVLVTVPLEGGGVESLAVWAARTQETGAACLRALPAQHRHPIERACTAMYEGCGRASAEELPWGEVVSARFPGARADRDGADTVRKQELKRLKSPWPTAE